MARKKKEKSEPKIVWLVRKFSPFSECNSEGVEVFGTYKRKARRTARLCYYEELRRHKEVSELLGVPLPEGVAVAVQVLPLAQVKIGDLKHSGTITRYVTDREVIEALKKAEKDIEMYDI